MASNSHIVRRTLRRDSLRAPGRELEDGRFGEPKKWTESNAEGQMTHLLLLGWIIAVPYWLLTI